MAEICATCRHLFKPDNVCRRFPPQVAVLSADKGPDGKREIESMSFFPTMNPSVGWCGEYRAAED